MYLTKFYITPEDILNQLSEEDKKKFNKCVFTNVSKEPDGTVTMTCLLFNDEDELHSSECRYRLKGSKQ